MWVEYQFGGWGGRGGNEEDIFKENGSLVFREVSVQRGGVGWGWRWSGGGGCQSKVWVFGGGFIDLEGDRVVVLVESKSYEVCVRQELFFE